MKKKANIYFGVIVAIMVWTFGILLLPFVVDDIDTFRTAMDCTNTSISYGSQLTCLVGDSVVPYFILLLASLALGFIVGGTT